MSSRIKQEIKVALAEAGHKFYELGWTPGEDSGDIAVRDPETGYIYMFPRPCKEVPVIRNWGMLEPDWISVADADGNLIDGHHIYPTVEWPMHVAIFRARKDINAIVHSHALYTSAFAITGQNVPLVLAEQVLFLGGETKCCKYGKVGSWELANNMVEALGEKGMTALLRNHGAIACAGDLDTAMSYHSFMEKCAKTAIMGKMLGNLELLDPNNTLDDWIFTMPWD